ncbi:tripartite tricarboxylate transporter substrate binding protein [Verticiella sediminum]|uniref:Tripartite tricarboxylate transporter substrate binding protein n=1 Tax=Verticiella sediminum TaxID=1247510 RepID=A0A556AWN0_9BURK|nr:tripartite tricarboxylate transporter substrate binding protein [Verticiella sediminum]TSH96795.1 tripartite tricarboxylate transporter substrate binding protein [Verticiella sediminum]
MKQIKRTVVAAMLLALNSVASAGNGPDGYPSEPVRFIVSFAPGGSTDIVARLVASELSKRIGQTIVVENKAGASGIIASQYVARANPDGYTLLIGGSGPMVFNPITQSSLPYDPVKDFEPVTILGSYPIVLLAGDKEPFDSVKDVVQYAKDNPGVLNYGSAGYSFQVPTEYFASVADIKLTQVPYKGSSEAAQALIAGDIQLFSADIGPGAPLATSGRAKPLAVTSAERNPVLPDVPTFAESGFPGFDFSLYSAVAAPKGTSTAITDYLQKELHAVLHSPEVSERLATMGIKPEGMPPAEAAARYAHEIELFQPIVDKMGIKVN